MSTNRIENSRKNISKYGRSPLAAENLRNEKSQNEKFVAKFRLEGSEEENSRMSSTRSSVEIENRPLLWDNGIEPEQEETYSFIMEDQPPPPPFPPPPPPFASLPVTSQFFQKVFFN